MSDALMTASDVCERAGHDCGSGRLVYSVTNDEFGKPLRVYEYMHVCRRCQAREYKPSPFIGSTNNPPLPGSLAK